MGLRIAPIVVLALIALVPTGAAPVMNHFVLTAYEHILYNNDPDPQPTQYSITYVGGWCDAWDDDLTQTTAPDGSSWNDRISSMRVWVSTCEVILYEHIKYNDDPNNPGGETFVCSYVQNCQDLTQIDHPDGGTWNDRVSSFYAYDINSIPAP